MAQQKTPPTAAKAAAGDPSTPSDTMPTGDQHPITDPDVGFGSHAEDEADVVETVAVYDATAKNPDKPRVHNIAGYDRAFYPLQPTMIPLAEALSVVQIDTFTIVGKGGKIYQPARQAVEKGTEALKLRNDQVIATLPELSMVALTKRAMRWGDHPDMPSTMSRSALETFIMARLSEPPAPTRRRATGERFTTIDDQGRVHQRLVMEEDEDDVDPTRPLRGDGEVSDVTPVAIQEALARRRASTAELSGYAARGGH